MANYYYVKNSIKPIPIGFEGENDARTVVFDIHKWIEDYGNGTALLVHQRPGDAEPYPVTTAQKAGTVEWTVQQADIIAGAPGRAQLSYQVGENIVARSPIYMTVAADEITNTPLADYDPAKSWIDDLLDAVNKAGDITSDVQAAQTAATQAGQSATAAAGSASDAAESATAAANSAAQAAQHAGEVTAGVAAAAESASQAAGSASSAEDSKTAAGQSAEAAAESEGNAAESASAAASSASAAQEAAESAQEYSGKPPVIQDDTWWIWDAETDKYEDSGHPATGEAAGFGEITATVDNAVGVPVVTVTESGSDTAKNLAFAFKNLKGEPGAAAGFGSATASVDGSTGTPDVTVSVSGPDTAKVFDFQFSGLKGQTGAAAGFGEITATVGATVGTPSVSVEASGPDTAKNLAFTFTNLKGEPGQSVGSIQRTAGTGAPGTTDTYTMYDDGGGVIGTFTVYNGTDGTGSGDFKADGSVPMTGDLNAGGHKIINVAAPTADGDAANKAYVDSVVDNVEIVKTASGSVISVSDSADYRLLGLKLYGKSVQDGVPTPEAPVEIESAGDGGNITTQIRGTNLLFFPDSVQTSNGITYEVSEGIVKVSGTATGEASLQAHLILPVGTYYVSGKINKCFCRAAYRYSSKDSYTYCNAPSSFTLIKPPYEVIIQILVLKNDTVDGILYPMLNVGTTSLPWEPYKFQNLTYPISNDLPGLPVDSGENYIDEDGQEWICDEVDFGRGKHIQRIGKIDHYTNEDVGDVYMSTTGQLTAGAKVLYPLTEPIETDLTPEQITAYAALTTYKPNTTITTDSSPAAGLEVKYLTDSGVAEVLDGKQDKLTGTAGQFVGFDAEGEAEAQEITAADVGAMPTVGGGTTGQYLRKTADGQAWQDGPDLSGYATQSWVNGRGFLTAVPDEYVTSTELTQALGDYVTADTLSGYGYITSAALNGYATQGWVQEQGYLTAVPAEYVTDTELTAKGYATTADVAETYAEKGFTWTGMLTAAGWSGSAAPYTQTVTISGMQATDNPFLGPNYTSTDVDTVKGEEEAFSLIGRIDSGAGNITVYIYEDSKPEIDIPILVKVVR